MCSKLLITNLKVAESNVFIKTFSNF